MSRIGKKPITLPQGITAEVEGNTIVVKGPKGSLDFTFKEEMTVNINESEIVVERPSESKAHRALHGTTRALINNMVVGVSEGFTTIFFIASMSSFLLGLAANDETSS